MRLEQLRFLCEIVDRGFNISRAAEALNTSQPGISRQIRLLEQELKFEVLRRQKGRLVGLTEPGTAVAQIARKVLRDAASIGRVHDEFLHHNSGEMVIATTHLHARYVLPPIVERFRRTYPRVQFNLLQANTQETIAYVSSGRADIGVAAEPPDGFKELIQLPSYAIRRSLIAPRGHPILRQRPLTLEKIAAYPHIAYDRSYPGGMAIKHAFDRKGIQPDIIVSAIDSEVIKAYVEIGMGLAVLPSVTFERKSDTSLASIDVTDLFGTSGAAILLHPEAYLRDYMYEFIHMVAPRWTRQMVSAAMLRGITMSPARSKRAPDGRRRRKGGAGEP